MPGTSISTGTIEPTPPLHAKLVPNTPPERAQVPAAITVRGVGMAVNTFSRAARIWSAPARTTSRMSAWRGVGVKKKPSRCRL